MPGVQLAMDLRQIAEFGHKHDWELENDELSPAYNKLCEYYGRDVFGAFPTERKIVELLQVYYKKTHLDRPVYRWYDYSLKMVWSGIKNLLYTVKEMLGYGRHFVSMGVWHSCDDEKDCHLMLHICWWYWRVLKVNRWCKYCKE